MPLMVPWQSRAARALCQHRGVASVGVTRALLMWVPIALALALVGATVGALIGRRVFHEGCGSRRLAPSQATTRLYCVRETQVDSTPALVLSTPRAASGDDGEDHEAAAVVAAVLPRAPSAVQKVCSFRRGIDVHPVRTRRLHGHIDLHAHPRVPSVAAALLGWSDG